MTVEQHGVVRTTRSTFDADLGEKGSATTDCRAARPGGGTGSIALARWRVRSGRSPHAVGTLPCSHARSRRSSSAILRPSWHGQLRTCRNWRGGSKDHLSAADDARRHAARLPQRVDKLRDLLADAFLLDEPDLTSKVGELENAQRSAVRARAELMRVSGARQILGDRIDVLRRSPLSEAEIDAMRGELVELSDRRERLFLALDALGYVAINREAVGWTDAEQSLSARQELVPSLKAQCENAEVEQRLAIETAQATEKLREEAYGAWRKVDDRRSAIQASREQAQRELAESGVDDPSDAAVERTRATTERLKLLVEDLTGPNEKSDRAIAQLGERLEGREKSLREAEEHLAKEEKEWKPAEELWERLRARAKRMAS